MDNIEDRDKLEEEQAREIAEAQEEADLETAQEATNEQFEFEAAVEEEANNIKEAEETNLEDADPENIEEVELAAVHEVAAEKTDNKAPSRDKLRDELFEPYISIEKAIARLPKYRQRRKAILALISPENANESDFKELNNAVSVMRDNNEDISQARNILLNRKRDMHVALYGEPIGRAIDSLYYKTDKKRAKMALMYPSLASPEDKKILDNAFAILDGVGYSSYVSDVREDLSKRQVSTDLQQSFDLRKKPGRQPKTVPLANEFIRDLINKSGMSEEEINNIIYSKNIHNRTGRQIGNVQITEDDDKILTNIKDEEIGEYIQVPQTTKLRSIEDAETSEDFTQEQIDSLIQALDNEQDEDIEEQAQDVSEEATELAEQAQELSEDLEELTEQPAVVQSTPQIQQQSPQLTDIQILQQGKAVTTHIPAFIDDTDRRAYQRQLDKWNNLTVVDQQKALNPQPGQGRGRGGRILDRMNTLSSRSNIIQKATATSGYTQDPRINTIKEQIQHAQIDRQQVQAPQIHEIVEDVQELVEQAQEVSEEADELVEQAQIEDLEAELQDFAQEFDQQESIDIPISRQEIETPTDSNDLIEWLNRQRQDAQAADKLEYAVASAQEEPMPDANAMLADPKYLELRDELNSGDINRVIHATKQLKILANDYGFMDEEDALESIDESFPTDTFESAAAIEIIEEPVIKAQPTNITSDEAKDRIREVLNVTMSTFDKDEAHMHAGKILEGANTEGLRFIDNDGAEISPREWARRIRIGDPTKQRELTVPSFSDQLPKSRQLAATTIADLSMGQVDGVPKYGKYLKFYAGNTMYVVDTTTKNVTKYPSKTAGHPYETLDTMGTTNVPPKDQQIKFGEGSIAIISGKVYWIDDGRSGVRVSIPRPTDSDEWKHHVTETFGSFARSSVPNTPQFPEREELEDEYPQVDIRSPEPDYGQESVIANNRAKRIGQVIDRVENVKEQLDFTKEADKVVKREQVHLEQLRRELSRAKAHIVDNPSVQVFDQIRRVENAIEAQKRRVEAAKDGRAEAAGRTVVAPFVKSIDIPEIDRDYVRTHSGNPMYAEYTQYPPTDPNYNKPSVRRSRKADRPRGPRAL